MNTRESPHARWERIIHQHKSSGQSIAEFCRRRGFSQPSFFAWRRRLRSTPGFVELKIAPPPEAERDGAPRDPAGLELLLPQGRRVVVRPGFDRQTLRDLLAALEEPA